MEESEQFLYIGDRNMEGSEEFLYFSAGLGICSSVFWANPWFLVSEKAIGRLAHGSSFVKSDKRESLPSLFKKEQLSEERWEQFALGHKKGEKQ